MKLMNFLEKNHVFIIAEAGSNWKAGTFEEDLERAKKLIDIASDSGADAIKFQTFKAKSIYVSNAGSSNYLSNNGFDENIFNLFEKLEMSKKMIEELAMYSKTKKIEFMSTPFSVDDAKDVDPFVSIHKIASFEINHIRLLEYLAKTKKPIILSTGASNYDEIEYAINLIKKFGNENISLLQCTSKYPCPLNSLNLSAITEFRKKFNLTTGLSDHSVEPIIAPLISVGLGGRIIEKHFTLDKSLNGPDHSFSLNPDQLKQMVLTIRNAEQTLGNGKKEILEVENELRNFATRSVQAIRDISKGEVLIEGENIDILRSGNQIRGTEPRFIDNIVGMKAIRDIDIGEGIIDNYE